MTRQRGARRDKPKDPPRDPSLEDFVRPVVAHLYLVWPEAVTRSRRFQFGLLRRLKSKIGKIYHARGPAGAAAWIKALSFSARLAAVTDHQLEGAYRRWLPRRTGRKGLLQVSRLGRCLPAVCPDGPEGTQLAAAARRQHRRDVTRRDPVPPWLLSQVARRITARPRPEYRRGVLSHPSVSSTVEVGRGNGGWLAAHRDGFMRTARATEKAFGPSLFVGVAAQHLPVVPQVLERWSDLAVRALGDEQEHVFGYPRARIAMVAERGYKLRAVTPLSATEVTVGHALRDALWGLLQADKVFDLGQEEDPCGGMAVREGEVVLSADLSRATDVVPHAWNAPLLGAIAVHAGLGRMWLASALEGLGPHYVGYEFTGPPTCRTTRCVNQALSSAGWLMGHPLTWAVLNLLHRELAAMSGLRIFKIRGDDLLGVGSPRAVGAYLSLMGQAGFLVNLRKTFRSPHGGVFAENLYLVEGGRLVRHAEARIPRSVFDGPAGIERCQDWADTLPTTERQRYVHALWFAAKGHLDKARRAGIPVHLPRSLGGVGMPDRKRSVPAIVRGSFPVTQMVTGCVPPGQAAWGPRGQVRVRSALLRASRNLTSSLHQRGGLARFVPIDAAWVNTQVQLRSAVVCLASPKEAKPTSIGSLAKAWSAWRARAAKHVPPARPIGEGWDSRRLGAHVRSQELSGGYRVYNPLLERGYGDPWTVRAERRFQPPIVEWPAVVRGPFPRDDDGSAGGRIGPTEWWD